MGQCDVSSRVVLALVAALVLLIMVACGASAPDAESEVADSKSLAPAAESSGSTAEVSVEETSTPTPSGGQASEVLATPQPSPTAVHGTQGSGPTAPPPPETVPVTFTPAATSVLIDPGVEKESSTPMPENTQPAYAPSGSRLPIFVEMVQAPLSPDLAPGMPSADFAPTGAYAYDPGSHLLLLPPAVEILPATEVLVGLATANVPNRPYLPSGLFQLPSSEAAPLSIVAVDAASGALTLSYAGQTFELQPGQSKSFKQKGQGELDLVMVITITNHGRLAATGPLPADPGSR